VTPTIGNSFTINPVLATDFKTLEIFDMGGTLIDTLDLMQTTAWNARNLSEGVYFMVATTQTGKKTTQKIVVKN
jgi:hypothetical protein